MVTGRQPMQVRLKHSWKSSDDQITVGSCDMNDVHQTISFSVSHRIPCHPTNTGSQQVSTRYSSTDGTPTAAGTPKAASPPISAASTAPTPPGVGAAEAR